MNDSNIFNNTDNEEKEQMVTEGLDENQQELLEMFSIPEFLIESINGWIREAWSEGCSDCQDDYYGVG